MGTSHGYYCPEHDDRTWFSGVRDTAPLERAWRNRELLIAWAELMDGEWWPNGLVDVGSGGPSFDLVQFLRQHRACTVRHYNEYGDIGDPILETEEPCPEGNAVYLEGLPRPCQLGAGHRGDHEFRGLLDDLNEVRVAVRWKAGQPLAL